MMMMRPDSGGHKDSMMHGHHMGGMNGKMDEAHEYEAQIAIRAKYLNVWIYFNLIFNTLLLPLLVLTFMFSKRAKRHAALVNMCITWIFSGIFSLLVFYCGDYGPDAKVPKPLCVAQTALLCGIAPMWAMSVLMLMVYISMAFRKPPKVATGPSLILLLSAPYITEIFFTVATLILAVNNQRNVGIRYQVYYCALENEPLLITMGLFTTTVGIMIILLEVYLGVIAYRVWQGKKHAGESSCIDIQILVRVLIFSSYIIFGMVMGLMKTVNPMGVIPDLYAATAGAVVFLTFGTQVDVIRAWLFWLPARWTPNSWKDKDDDPPPYIGKGGSQLEDGKGERGEIIDEVPPMPPPKPIWYLNGMALNNGTIFIHAGRLNSV